MGSQSHLLPIRNSARGANGKWDGRGRRRWATGLGQMANEVFSVTDDDSALCHVGEISPVPLTFLANGLDSTCDKKEGKAIKDRALFWSGEPLECTVDEENHSLFLKSGLGISTH